MSDAATHYRVLARKYRPQTFAELIGQEAMVRTLANAIASGRVAHAFILTGVRGVGKTTTARIIARALNCVGPDGTGGPTAEPCGECVHCRSIAEDRHVDVIEMDAASRTGVDDIRELTDGMRYRPVSARFKIYIIDEVHMLSKNAFNALLKTLEEPPPDVKFVFATTEIQKVPVTVLSRCQRFSLRRVPIDQLVAHYQGIAAAESVEIEPAALGLIARAADGSVRDGLSLLDQAIALAGGSSPGGPIGEAMVRDMLGIADRNLIFDLFETVLKGDAAGALDRMEALYQGGADPLSVIQDLLDLAHFVTRLKLVPGRRHGRPDGGGRPRARPAPRRGASDAGAGASLADAAEGHRGSANRSRRPSGGGNGAGAARLCRRLAGAGRTGQKRRPRHRAGSARIACGEARPSVRRVGAAPSTSDRRGRRGDGRVRFAADAVTTHAAARR